MLQGNMCQSSADFLLAARVNVEFLSDVIDADVVYNTAARGVRVTFENSLTLNTTANQSNTTELSLAERDSEGKPVRKQYPATRG